MCKNITFLGFLELILTWSLPFHNVRNSTSFIPGAPLPRDSLPPAKEVQRTHIASKPWGGPFRDPPLLGSVDSPTALVWSPSDSGLCCFHSTLGYLSLWWAGNVWSHPQATQREKRAECTDISHFPQGKCLFPSEANPLLFFLQEIQQRLLEGLGTCKYQQGKYLAGNFCFPPLDMWILPRGKEARGLTTFLNLG